MKKLLTLALSAALLLSMASCNTAESDSTTTAPTSTTTAITTRPVVTPPETEEPEDDLTDLTDLFIPYGSAAVDGVKEAAWDNAATVALELVKKDSPAADTSVSASVMWDNDALYFLFEITDSDIYTAGALGDYNNDGIYLYVSEDVNSMIANLSDFSNGVYQFALSSADNEMLPRKGNASEVTNAASAYTRTEGGMIIEFCYTPTRLPNKAGNFLLLDYQYNDSGASGTRKGNLGWYNGTDINGTPSMWAIVKLLAEGETAPNN